MSQLKKGALLSYITIFLTNIIGLLLTPFIIKKLGDAEYGLYTLIGAFVGYISVLDFGLNNTIVRFVAKYRAEKDKKGEENFLAITMGIYGVIAVIIVLVGVVLYFNLDTIFSNSLTLEELSKAKVMFIVLIFNLAITLPGGAFTAICSGYEHFVFPRTVNIIRYLVRSLMVVGLLLLGGDAIGLVILDTVMNILVIVFNGFYVLKKLKVVFKLHYFETPLVKEIFSYSVWIFIYTLVHQFQWNTGQIILGVNTDTVVVAIYGVGVLIGGYYAAFGGAINRLLLPKATRMVVDGIDGLELTETMIKFGRINSYVLTLIISGFFLFGQEFISFWVGEKYSQSWLIGLVMMFVLTLPLIQGFGISILEAKKKNRFKSILSVITVGLAILFGFYFSKQNGVIGVIIPLGFAILLNNIIMNFYYKRIFDFKIYYFFKMTLFKLGVITIALIVVFMFVKTIYIIETWLKLIIFILIYSVSYISLIYQFLLNKYEKKILIDKFR